MGVLPVQHNAIQLIVTQPTTSAHDQIAVTFTIHTYSSL